MASTSLCKKMHVKVQAFMFLSIPVEYVGFSVSTARELACPKPELKRAHCGNSLKICLQGY